MDISADERRQAFGHYLRTGRWPRLRAADGREIKFNPYHDPRNGQFTFAPGGPRSLSRVIVSKPKRPTSWQGAARDAPAGRPEEPGTPGNGRIDAVFRPGEAVGGVVPVGLPPGSHGRRGSNIRRFYDPQTLQQAFPGLTEAPGGAVIAAADYLFDITGPAQEARIALTRGQTQSLIAEIKAIDPTFEFQSLAEPVTVEGQTNQLNMLRFIRAAKLLRIRGNIEALQIETVAYVQRETDRAYDEGLRQLSSGRLRVRLSEREALGNFVDRETRIALRRVYDLVGIESGGSGPVRVNRREKISNETEGSFRRPDARIGNVAVDVTIAAKSPKTPQVRGFFDADFRPDYVVIIRPRQLGPEHTYIITRGKAER